VVNIGERSWSAAYAGWRIHVTPEAVQAVVEAAAKFEADINEVFDWAETPPEKRDVLMRRYVVLELALCEA
jgi:hypothetical protein